MFTRGNMFCVYPRGNRFYVCQLKEIDFMFTQEEIDFIFTRGNIVCVYPRGYRFYIYPLEKIDFMFTQEEIYFIFIFLYNRETERLLTS